MFQNVTIHLQIAQYYKGSDSVLKVKKNLPRRFLSLAESHAKRVIL